MVYGGSRYYYQEHSSNVMNVYKQSLGYRNIHVAFNSVKCVAVTCKYIFFGRPIKIRLICKDIMLHFVVLKSIKKFEKLQCKL